MANKVMLVSTGYLAVVLLSIAIIDARAMVIPNTLNLLNFVGGAAFAGLNETISVPSCLVGGGLGFTLLLAIRSAYRHIRGEEGLGFGDVKFMAGAGLWVGWQGVAPLLTIASVSALAYLPARKMWSKDTNAPRHVPFGPFLALGTMAVWILQAVGVAPWNDSPW